MRKQNSEMALISKLTLNNQNSAVLRRHWFGAAPPPTVVGQHATYMFTNWTECTRLYSLPLNSVKTASRTRHLLHVLRQRMYANE